MLSLSGKKGRSVRLCVCASVLGLWKDCAERIFAIEYILSL